MARNESFFQRLTRLFRSGPSIQRRIKGQNPGSYYDTKLVQGNYGYRAPAPFGFGRENSPFSTLGSYGILDRMARYAEFSEMEYTPEIASAMDIYADEVAGGDEHGHSFHVFSDNTQIKRALEELFYDVLNVEFNLRPWTRNLVKYGDFFLYNEVLPEVGVINAQPIPVNELEREEGFDEEDPYAIRFKWLTRGNVYLENWQVTHLRIQGNDLFLPYGTAILEPARRIWRQLIMMEDAMLVYRVVRSPERRVFYIDVGNVAPNDVPSYMEAAKGTLRSHSVIDRSTGRQDLRYNPLAVDEDYYIPVRGNQSGTRIESLAGGQHVTATEDVQYIQSKLFAALKVPKPYLNYDENLSSKATLAQVDVRFSRTVGNIQKIIIAEMTKLAMIHLYAEGFDGEDLIDFELKLSNPSTVAIQQKLELWATKMDLAGAAKETGLVDSRWIQRHILELTEDDIKSVDKGLYEDKIRETQLDQVAFEEEREQQTTTDPFSQANYGMSGDGVPKDNTHEPPQPPGRGTDVIIPHGHGKKRDFKVKWDPSKTPVKASPFANRNRKNRKRRVGQSGRGNNANPDFGAMLHPGKNKSLTDIYDKDFLKNPTRREGLEIGSEDMVLGERRNLKFEISLPREVHSMLIRMDEKFSEKTSGGDLLIEGLDLVEFDDDELLINNVLSEEPGSGDNLRTLQEAFSAGSNSSAEESIEFELE